MGTPVQQWAFALGELVESHGFCRSQVSLHGEHVHVIPATEFDGHPATATLQSNSNIQVNQLKYLDIKMSKITLFHHSSKYIYYLYVLSSINAAKPS